MKHDADRVIITDNVVRAKYSEPLADHVTLDIPNGALTDMNSVQKYEGLNLKYEIKLEKRLFDAVVDKNGKGDYTKIQDAIDNAPNNSDVPYLIFVADGVYEEYLNISASKTFIHLIGQSRENTKVQYLMNRVKWDGTGEQPVAWPYSSQNPAYQAQTGLTSSQESIVLVKGADFHAENISFINLYGARVDEYGGIKWVVGQEFSEISWGYGNAPKTIEEVYERMEDLTDAILYFDHICGYCYTQLTDVEQEQNGIYNYDRTEKFDMDRIRAIFSKVPKGFK